ncbi:hypothetical protein F5Y10DRAFT_250888 [Nemania abortiva]|nr:hypothetical protein F5Y10DRAFT_250888 [Nemania abortiva]
MPERQDLHVFKIPDAGEIFDGSATETRRPRGGRAQYTNAPLDPSTLKRVLTPDFGHDLQIFTLNTRITPSQCSVHYSIGNFQSSYQNKRVFVELTQCCNPSASKDYMKRYLCSFEGPISKLAKRADIGSYSLKTDTSIFWVRDTIFAKVFVNYDSDVPNEPSEESTSRSRPARIRNAIRGRLERSGIRRPNISTSSRSLLKIHFELAQIIDEHLAKYSVSREQQTRPSIGLRTPRSMTVSAGREFKIELDAPDSLHTAKPAEIENDNVLQVTNGSALGKYEFFAMKAGETKIKLVLAHALTLAVECIDIDTTVEPDPRQLSIARTNGGPNTSHGTGLRLLSLDGGGIRGLSTLYILKALMDSLNYERQVYNVPVLKPCHVFDLIGGTSTGGLIAIMLGRLEMDINRCISAYIDLMKTVFDQELPVGRPISPPEPGTPVYTILNSAVEKVITRCGSSRSTLFCDGVDRRCKVFVCAAKGTNETSHLRSYRSTQELDNRVTICDAAVAAFTVGVLAHEQHIAHLVHEITSEALDIWCPETKDLKPLVDCFISIGVGIPSDKAAQSEQRLFQSSSVPRDAEKRPEMRAVALMDQVYKGRPHFRFNIGQGLKDVGFLEYRDRINIEQATVQYLDQMEEDVQRCVSCLMPKQELWHGG